MRKTSRIIEISGFMGLVILLFSITCLFVGFVVFPGYLAMNLWNKLAVSMIDFRYINLFQGVLLWGIFALTVFIARGGKSPIAFRTASQLDENEIVDLMSKIKERTANKKIQTMFINKDDLNNLDIFNNTESEDSKQENKKENL